MLSAIKQAIKVHANVHRSDDGADVFLFSTPRSGSTWLMELIWSQPGFKPVNEPLNLRNPYVRRHLGINRWQDLYTGGAEPALEHYIRGFQEWKHLFLNSSPLHRYYRSRTSRLVFKVIHGGEDRIPWFRDRFGGNIVLLVRHPIAVSLSREIYPRLEAFLESDYRRHFSGRQLRLARDVIKKGSRLEQGVLSWCLQNAVPLREATADWVVLTYEQMVLDPGPLLKRLGEKLELDDIDRMSAALSIPSLVKGKSDPETQRLLENYVSNRRKIVDKWCQHVDKSAERQAMTLLSEFDIDAYHYDDVLPSDRLWVNEL